MKHNGLVAPGQWNASPPSRGRGLKLLDAVKILAGAYVAPLAGAWIETRYGLAREK